MDAVARDHWFLPNCWQLLARHRKIPQDQKGEDPGEFESLEFKNVCFSYKDEETIKDLSFRVDKGDIVA